MTLHEWSENLAQEMTTLRNKYLGLMAEIEPEADKKLAKFSIKLLTHGIRLLRYSHEDVEL